MIYLNYENSFVINNLNVVRNLLIIAATNNYTFLSLSLREEKQFIWNIIYKYSMIFNVTLFNYFLLD